MNYFLFQNMYLRRWQECHPTLRFLVSHLIMVNNLLGRRDGEATEPPAGLAAFYYVLARKEDRSKR